MNVNTLPELRRVYEQARMAMIQRHNEAGLTQTEAAKRLGIDPRALNNIIARKGITWRVVRQGPRKDRT